MTILWGCCEGIFQVRYPETWHLTDMARGIESLVSLNPFFSMDSAQGEHSDHCKFWLLDLGRWLYRSLFILQWVVPQSDGIMIFLSKHTSASRSLLQVVLYSTEFSFFVHQLIFLWISLKLWIRSWHYCSKSNLVNAPLCDEVLNLLKSHWQDYILYVRSFRVCTILQSVIVGPKEKGKKLR